MVLQPSELLGMDRVGAAHSMSVGETGQVRLLHVITGLNVGGAETMLARLLEARRRAPDILPEVASLMAPGFVGDRIAATGVTVHDLGMRGIVSSVPAVGRLVALIRRSRPDVIMAWMHHGQLAATVAVALARTETPVIWNIRHSLSGYAREKATTRMILRLQARLSRTPAAVVYNSQAGAREYRAFGLNPGRELVIPNGFEASALPGTRGTNPTARELFKIPDGPMLIGMVARAHPMKDVPNLVAAFKRTLEAGVDAHLLLVGEGMDRPMRNVSEILARLPRRRWTVSGQRGDVASWLGTLDVLALPSAWGEGFPNIVGEALLGAVPCIGTDIGDTALVIGQSGFTVRPGDPRAFANGLIELARMGPAARRQMGMQGQIRMREHYTIDRIFDRYAELCRGVAGVRPPDALTCVDQSLRDAA